MTSRTLVLGLVAASAVVTARFAAAQETPPPGVSVAASASATISVSATPAPVDSAAPPPVASAAPPPVTPPPVIEASGGVTVTVGSDDTSGTKKDEATKVATPDAAKDKPLNPFKGSSVILDQSMTANSAFKDAQQSWLPYTETWISARLNYNFSKKFRVGLRADFFLEETDTSGDTALRNQWHIGDLWVTGGYSDAATFINDNPGTRWNLGAILRPPTSKESQANGAYVGAGVSAGLAWTFDLNKGGKWFPEGTLNPIAQYSHSFTQCTTPCGAVHVPNASPTGTATTSDQVRSGTIAGDSLLYALNADLTIYDKISLSASMIFISQFAYTPPAIVYNGSGTGNYAIPSNPNDTHLRQLSWFLVDVNYDLIEELSLSLGYYNLHTVVGPSGRYLDPLGSVDSRLFFDVVVHLDALYDDARGKGGAKKPAAVAKR